MINVFSQGCIGVTVDGLLAGCVFFHPYHEDLIKSLNFSLSLDGKEDCIYLHDMAILSEYRGQGLTRILMDRVDKETLNRGFALQCLVAVQESQNFWLKYGFNIVKKIEKYGVGPAYYMKRSMMA